MLNHPLRTNYKTYRIEIYSPHTYSIYCKIFSMSCPHSHLSCILVVTHKPSSFAICCVYHPCWTFKSINRENNKVPFPWVLADAHASNHTFRIYSVSQTGADWVSTGIQPTSPAQPKVTQQRYGFLMQCPFVVTEVPALYSPHIDFLQGGE